MKFTRYHLILSPVTDLILPPYKGSTLSGGFGRVLKQDNCMNREEKTCTECILRSTCTYLYIFKTTLFNVVHSKAKGNDHPHPLIIEPPLDWRQFYKTGDKLDFDIILVGTAIDYINVIMTFKKLGIIGIGKYRNKYTDNGKYKLDKVINTSFDSETIIYDGKFHIINDSEMIDSADFFNVSSGPSCSKVTLRFLTPTRIKYDGNFIDNLNFEILMRNLLRRLSWLAEIYSDEKWDLDWNGIISRAKKGVRTVHSDLLWNDWERYSETQGKKLKMGGFMGGITFEGDLDEFLPFLRLGEYLHVGKGTVYGLGKYEILEE